MKKCKKNRILFYSSVKSKRMFSVQGFYRTDIQILKENGYSILLSNHFWDFFFFWEYDIAFIYFYRYGLLPAIISKVFRKKVFFTGGIDDLCLQYAGKKRYTIQKYFFKLCNLFSNASIIVSNDDLKNIELLYKRRIPNNLKICFHAIDFEAYKYNFIEKKRKIITTVAWMLKKENVYRKGVDKTIFILEALKKIDDEWKLRIIGPKGGGSVLIERIIKEKGLEKSVIITGGIPEIEKIKFLKESLVYLQLSDYEGFGIAAIEGLASGNIVFHSGKGGLKDGISHFGIEVEDISNFLDIANLINLKIHFDSNQKYEDFIKEGIMHVKKNFSFNVRKKVLGDIMRG